MNASTFPQAADPMASRRSTVSVLARADASRAATLAAWQRLSPLSRCAAVAAGVLAIGLLCALAQTCEEAVARGERLRAEQRQLAATKPVPAVAAPLLTARAPGGAGTGL